MGILTCQVAIPRDNGLARDTVVHTWNFLTAGEANGDDGAGAELQVLDFYNTAGATSGSKVSSYLAGFLNASASVFKAYNLADAPPRVPVYETVIPIDNNASTNHLPGEVALCLSFAAAPASGSPAARRRGRVFIGPFSQGAIGGTGTADDSRPLQALREAMRDGAARMIDGTHLGTGCEWAVFSRTPDPAAYPVVRAWVDDAWDTQRRRGARATGRMTTP